MKKYPVVYTYTKTPDHGRELMYSIRSLSNLLDWDGRVFVVGDKEEWFSEKIFHLEYSVKHINPYVDVAYKLTLIDNIKAIPDDYIYMMDDVYITEPVMLGNIYKGFIKDIARQSIHTKYVHATGEFLKSKHDINEPLNYEVHAPFLINKKKLSDVYKLINFSLKTDSPLQWKSVYGNIYHIGGENVSDNKTYDSHLMTGTYISTSFYTEELNSLFPKSSDFEIHKKKIAIVSHFSPIKMTTGMIKLVNYIAEHLSKDFKVDVIAVRDNFPSSIKIGNVGYYLGRNHLNNLYEYDLVIAHPPMNIIDHPNLVLLYDSDKDVNTPNAPKYIDHKMAIFTTEHIRKAYDSNGIILHPMVFPEDNYTTRGDKITLIGASEYKGINVLEDIAKLMPDKEFLVVKSGWQKEIQTVPHLKNIESMREVSDLKDIWSKTRILISPSKGEQYGMASLESMASGIPVIAYRCPGVEEALGDAAELLDTFDANEWVAAINRVEENYLQYVNKSYSQSKKINSHKELEKLTKEIQKLCKNL